MRFVSLPVLTAIFSLVLCAPVVARAENADLSITAGSIHFSKSELYAGDTVRIYATIRNQGNVDSTAQVFFYQGDVLIGKSQPISVIADGGGDDVFVDYTLPQGAFNLRAVIQGAEPADNNPNNDVAITPLFRTILDDDRDGIENEKDNCSDEVNVDQKDLDGDSKGDVCDNDIDNDGVVNAHDAYPEDPRKSQLETPAPATVVVSPKTEPAVITTPQPVPVQPTNSQSEVRAEVLGEQADQPAAEVALQLPQLGDSQPLPSPTARFTYQQVNWRTYEFKAAAPLGGVAYAYTWNFGDQATSVQPTITHTFPKAGNYTVTLAMVGPENTVINHSEVIRVSFFHLNNPLVLISLVGLAAIIFGLIVFILRLRRGEEV